MRALTAFVPVLVVCACGGKTPAPASPSPPEPRAEPAPVPAVEPDAGAPPTDTGSSPAAPAEVSCDGRADPMAPIMMTPEQWDARRGAGVTKLSELNTTKDDPAQACMAAHSYLWLSKLTCDDGSRPLADSRAAQQARAGNVGPGGKCGNIVDRYRVSCPEGDVDVFIDMYWCTEAALSPAPKGV